MNDKIILHKHLLGTGNITVLPSGVLENDNLNWKDLGLLAYMLSKPADWNFSYKYLQSMGRAGQSAICSSVRNLKSAGYLRISRKREHGRFAGAIWCVSDAPIFIQEE